MRTELGSWRRAWRRVGKVGKAEVEVEEAEARRRARRRASRGGGGGGRGGGRACALIKSNNPHLAGGEKTVSHYQINHRQTCRSHGPGPRVSPRRWIPWIPGPKPSPSHLSPGERGMLHLGKGGEASKNGHCSGGKKGFDAGKPQENHGKYM